jgi:hypothetical protein
MELKKRSSLADIFHTGSAPKGYTHLGVPYGQLSSAWVSVKVVMIVRKVDSQLGKLRFMWGM